MKHADKLIKRVLFLGGLPRPARALKAASTGEKCAGSSQCGISSWQMIGLPDTNLAISFQATAPQ